VEETPGTFDLPEGYRLDLLGDPDAPALRRPDGTVVARFAARGLRREAVEREALEDLMGASKGQGTSTSTRGIGPVRSTGDLPAAEPSRREL